MHLSSGHLTEQTAGRAGPAAKDSIRLEGSADDAQSVVVSTRAPRREFDIQHLRHDGPGTWRSVKVCNAVVTKDRQEVRAPVALDQVEISGTTSRRRRRAQALRRRQGLHPPRTRPPGPGRPAPRLAPSSWDGLSRAKLVELLE